MRASALFTVTSLIALASSAALPPSRTRVLHWSRQASNGSTTCDLSTVSQAPPHAYLAQANIHSPSQATASPPLTTAPPSPPANSTGGSGNSSSCDLSQVQQPPAPTALPAPDGLNLVLIALGQGTQNYTCANSSATPASIGAVATLKDASCAVAGGATEDELGSLNEDAAAIGAHFFVTNTSPDFDVDSLGNTVLAKSSFSNAPANSNGDVQWLMLETQQVSGTTSQVKRVYRLETRGGAAPGSCAGQAPGAVMTSTYEAEYWFYT